MILASNVSINLKGSLTHLKINEKNTQKEIIFELNSNFLFLNNFYSNSHEPSFNVSFNASLNLCPLNDDITLMSREREREFHKALSIIIKNLLMLIGFLFY